MTKTRFIIVTQREIQIDSEARDSIDRRWFDFFKKSNLTPIIAPNDIELVKAIFTKIEFDGILLTGGGDIKACGGKDKKREEVEDFLIEYAIKKKIPLVGICRGMQKIQNYFGVKIDKVLGHVAQKQKILINNKLSEVNSYHDFGTKENNSKEFEIFAIAKDEVIKGIKHKKHNITAIMWHPERIIPNRKEDIKLFNEVFK